MIKIDVQIDSIENAQSQTDIVCPSSWNLSANVSYNKNKLLELYNGVEEYVNSTTGLKYVQVKSFVRITSPSIAISTPRFIIAPMLSHRLPTPVNNIGLTLGIFNRVNLNVDFYHKKTTNMLMLVPQISTPRFIIAPMLSHRLPTPVIAYD